MGVVCRSAGKKQEFEGEEYTIEELTENRCAALTLGGCGRQGCRHRTSWGLELSESNWTPTAVMLGAATTLRPVEQPAAGMVAAGRRKGGAGGSWVAVTSQFWLSLLAAAGCQRHHNSHRRAE